MDLCLAVVQENEHFEYPDEFIYVLEVEFMFQLSPDFFQDRKEKLNFTVLRGVRAYESGQHKPEKRVNLFPREFGTELLNFYS